MLYRGIALAPGRLCAGAIVSPMDHASGGADTDQPFATHSTSLPHAADGCIARMMRKPNRARLTSHAALLVS